MKFIFLAKFKVIVDFLSNSLFFLTISINIIKIIGNR